MSSIKYYKTFLQHLITTTDLKIEIDQIEKNGYYIFKKSGNSFVSRPQPSSWQVKSYDHVRKNSVINVTFFQNYNSNVT